MSTLRVSTVDIAKNKNFLRIKSKESRTFNRTALASKALCIDSKGRLKATAQVESAKKMSRLGSLMSEVKSVKRIANNPEVIKRSG